jgi:hypothetical protein
VRARLPRAARRAVADYMLADFMLYGLDHEGPEDSVTSHDLYRRWDQRADQAEAVLARHLGRREASRLLDEIVFLDDAHYPTKADKVRAVLSRWRSAS